MTILLMRYLFSCLEKLFYSYKNAIKSFQLIQFLMSLVQPTRAGNPNGNNVGVKRPYQLMINSAAHNSGDGTYPGRFKNLKLDKETLMEDMNEDNLVRNYFICISLKDLQ